MLENPITTEIVFIADPAVLAIPVYENDDPMINVLDQHELIYGPSPEIPNNTDYTKMRKTVYEKLLLAQNMLPAGLRFCLYECYRSLTLQQQLFDHRWQQVLEANPNMTHEQLFHETTRLVSPIINLDGSRNVPPHATGGAIDVYLIDQHGIAIDMGIHPKDWLDDLDGHISLTDSMAISHEAKAHRKIMSEVLSVVGFANYPNEYWHWSYGDRYWAFQQNHPNAIYDVM